MAVDLKNKMVCFAKGFLRLGLVILMFFTVFAGFAAGEEISSNQTMPSPIPLAEIATQAIKIPDFFRDLHTQFASDQEFDDRVKNISDDISRMALEEQVTMKTLRMNSSLERLQVEGKLWQKNKAGVDEKLTYLSGRADKYQGILNQIENLQKIWRQTLDFAESNQAQDTIIQEINEVIQSIETEQKSIQNRLAAVMDLQRKAAERVAQCEKILDQISQTQRMEIAGSGGVKSHPIWSREFWEWPGKMGFAKVREIIAYPKKDIEFYFFGSNGLILIHLGLFVFLSVLFIMMRNKSQQSTSDEGASIISYVLEQPYAASFVVTLIFVAGPFFSTPATVKDLFAVIALMVMIRLMKHAIEKQILFALYALWFLFALDMMRHSFTSVIFLNHVMILAEALSGLAVLGWSLKYGVLTPSFIKTTGMIRLYVFRGVAIFAMVLFTAGLVSGISGYLFAAHIFVSSVIVGGALALELFVFIKIFMGLAAFCLRARPLRLLLIVNRHRYLLERRLYRFLTWVGIGVWIIRVLDYAGLFQPALLLGNALLVAKLERGSVSISLGDVFAFILTVLIARYLARFICFILNEDVFPRTKVSYGVRYATTRLIDYLIMVFGFLIGVGLVGIDLTKVTVLIGAFSVGIGFGLQSVVNNFVSGLILLFERPIQMGDTIEVGNILGIVRRIGIRASILRSRQGAEIIIPNSQLISEQVTNWTLSDQRRRIELPIGVNYNSNPQKVIEVIEAVASAHLRVLKNPKPQVLLTGFGDSSINYELRAWTDEFDDYQIIRSDLAVAIYDAIAAANMSFPFPQREVRLLKDNEA